MTPSARIDRVVLVVMDGLRTEAVQRLPLPAMKQLMGNGAWTLSARTVTPSVTAAAMTSLLTGVPPERHGIGGEGFGIPRDIARLHLLPRQLSRAHRSTSLHFARIPLRYRWLAARLGHLAGVDSVRSQGDSSREIVAHARNDLVSRKSDFVFMHWPEADRAGHVHGWGSAAYDRAAQAMDDSLAGLVEILGVGTDPGTLLILCADHGGGGVDPLDHESDHLDDISIPIVLAGAGVAATHLGSEVTLLDLPPTILWTLGVDIPSDYGGRPLREAFLREAWAA